MEDSDDHGQPRNRLFNYHRLADRTIDELIGLTKGIVIDGIIMDEEADFLIKWMREHEEYIRVSGPARILYNRINELLEDNYLDSEERAELFDLLRRYSGIIPAEDEIADMTSTLPYDSEPYSEIVFPDRTFCFTGKFLCSGRKNCVQLVEKMGGIFQSSVGPTLDYLFVGMIGSSDWIHSSYGRKLEGAIDLRQLTGQPRILPESHWVKTINNKVI